MGFRHPADKPSKDLTAFIGETGDFLVASPSRELSLLKEPPHCVRAIPLLKFTFAAENCQGEKIFWSRHVYASVARTG
jgi:hypothetical protein